MNHTKLITAAWATLALSAAGCLDGELTSGMGGPPTTANASEAQAQFESQVRPILARCGGASCHSGTGNTPLKFLGDTAQTDDYAAIIGSQSVLGGFNPASASVLTKIQAGGHYNMTFSQGDVDKISAWLEAEGSSGKGGGDVNPVASGSLASWAGCMTIGNWNTVVDGTATSMGTWSDKNSNEGPCQNCHNEGAYRFNTNNNNNDMYNMNRSELYVISFFTLAVSDTGTTSIVPAYDKLVRMGNGTTLHPQYNVDVENDVHFQALTQFYDLTAAASEAGDCLTPGFYQP